MTLGKVFPHLHADQSLQLAWERLRESGFELLPLAGRADVHKLEGAVLLEDVLDFYAIGAEHEN